MPQLELSTYLGQFIWLFISFIILYLFVYFLFIPRIERIVVKRSDFIKKNIDAAEDALHKAQRIRAELAMKLQETRDAARLMVSGAEYKMKLLITSQTIDNENEIANIIKKEAAKLFMLRQKEIKESGNIIDELKYSIIEKLDQPLKRDTI